MWVFLLGAAAGGVGVAVYTLWVATDGFKNTGGF
jgi:hypothetical protein